jgi:hypothetical protein
LALKPISRSWSSTRIRSEVHRHRLETGCANRADDGLRIAVAYGNDRAAAAPARQFRAESAVFARNRAQFFELRRRYLQGVQHALTYIHELAERWQVVVLYGLNAAQRQGVDLVEDPLI